MDANMQVWKFQGLQSEYLATDDNESNVMNCHCLEMWDRYYFVSLFFSYWKDIMYEAMSTGQGYLEAAIN